MILGSFFYGYIMSQILGAVLAQTSIGAARLMGIAIFGTSVLTLATPVIADKGGVVDLVVVRVLIGILQGVVIPAMHELWSHWAPPLERSKLVTISQSGLNTGAFVTMALCGLISQYLGWPWIFYLFGSSGILWFAFWTWLIYEDPSKDPNISIEEREYIPAAIGGIKRVKFSEAPWKSILTSLPIWAAMMAHTVQNSGYYTMLTQLPSFLRGNI